MPADMNPSTIVTLVRLTWLLTLVVLLLGCTDDKNTSPESSAPSPTTPALSLDPPTVVSGAGSRGDGGVGGAEVTIVGGVGAR